MARALTALTIGPLDPTGRNGIIADTGTFSSLGLHPAAVATETGDTALDPDVAIGQIDAVLGSIKVDAVKLACPSSVPLLEGIAAVLTRHDVHRLVIDTDRATTDVAALDVVKARLLPLSLVALVDISEAALLTGIKIETWDDVREAARAIAALGAANVLVKGSDLAGDQSTDILFDGNDFREYSAARVPVSGVVGTGTTFAAAVTATLAKQDTVQHSIAAGKAYVTKALQDAYDLGSVPALHHFYRYWRPSGQ